jgi:hypothetical protein
MENLTLNNTIALVQNDNAPHLHFCKIVEDMGRFIKLENEYNFIISLPKSALKLINKNDIPTYSFEQWFRDSKAIHNAFKIFE